MATRRERVVLELNDNFSGRMAAAMRAADWAFGKFQLPRSDRAAPGMPGPQVWEGDQA